MMKRYDVLFSNKAKKSIQQIDPYHGKMIVAWIEKNLVGCQNPRIYGKPLTGNKHGYWRYRIGSYRLIAEINDQEIRIELIHISHRKDVYKH